MARNQDLKNPVEILDSSSSSSFQDEISLGSSDSDSDSDSRTESDDLSLLVVKPIASKPPLKSEGGRNPRSEAGGSNPVKSGGLKRSAVEKESGVKEGKKLKKVVENSDQQLSGRRRWSMGDEIVILEGMIEFLEEKRRGGRGENLKGFYNFIKEDLPVGATRAQLRSKIQRLKSKYDNSRTKEKKGKEKVHTESHQDKTYELSKLVWGNWKETSGRKTQKKNPEDGDGDGDAEKEWRKLKILEMEVHLQKLELQRAQMQLAMDALKRSLHK